MLIKFCGRIIVKLRNICLTCIETYEKSLFESCGEHVDINRGGVFTYKNISIGDDCFIGVNPIMQSRHGKIIIGNHIAFGPCVHIFGGNHKFDIVGEYVKNLSSSNDGSVVIEDDCWVGSNVTILRGVHIGKGSIIGAGTIVTKNVPPYSIITNKIETVSRNRFTAEEILRHEQLLMK